MYNLFSEFLMENVYKTKEEISKAIQSFKNIQPKSKQSEARNILKSAQKIGYVVRSEEVLKYDTTSKDIETTTNDIKNMLNLTNNDIIVHKQNYGCKTNSFDIIGDNYMKQSDVAKMLRKTHKVESFIVTKNKDGKYVTNIMLKAI